jgi:hypothetical protein
VGILRLMDAPRVAVIDKLLAAHKIRAKKLIDEYMPQDTPKPVLTGHQAYAHQINQSKQQLLEEHLQSVASARKFHQTMIVSLVEATKGTSELYDNTKSSSSSAGQPSTELAREEIEAYNKLNSTICELAPRSTDCLVKSMKYFFSRYNAHVHQCSKLEASLAVIAEAKAKSKLPSQKPVKESQGSDPANPFDDDDTDHVANNGVEVTVAGLFGVVRLYLWNEYIWLCCVEEKTLNQELRSVQLALYDLEEEKSAWLLLIRQALVEWEFLDSSLKKCYPSKTKIHLANGGAALSANDNPFDSDDEGSKTQKGAPAVAVASPCKPLTRYFGFYHSFVYSNCSAVRWFCWSICERRCRRDRQTSCSFHQPRNA